MAQQTIGLGAAANDGTGDSLRVAGGKINDNFTELYTRTRPTFTEWDGTGDTVPVDVDAIGSGTSGAILSGDSFFLGAGGGNFNPSGLGTEYFPPNTIITAKQNSPTLASHYIFKA